MQSGKNIGKILLLP